MSRYDAMHFGRRELPIVGQGSQTCRRCTGRLVLVSSYPREAYYCVKCAITWRIKIKDTPEELPKIKYPSRGDT